MHRLQNSGRNQGKAIGLNLPSSNHYVGRFAPSPTGPLHLGSLFTALASFLDARRHQGSWLLRIDDLDAPRNKPGMATDILDCLSAYGLLWDGDVYYQSRHSADYAVAMDKLRTEQRAYPCACSRKQLSQHHGTYPGFCRDQHLNETGNAMRIKTCNRQIQFIDALQGHVNENLATEHGDFVIKRKEGIIAYQLAVVIDDHIQQVNCVVRGVDLLDSTAKQLYLHELLGYPVPRYMHLPVIVDREGNKLSKQTCAEAVDRKKPAATLFLLLELLKQNPPDLLKNAAPGDILDWAIAHWQPEPLKKLRAIGKGID